VVSNTSRKRSARVVRLLSVGASIIIGSIIAKSAPFAVTRVVRKISTATFVTIVLDALKSAKGTKMKNFTVECLGVDYPDYFQGYGLGPNSEYSNCCYGIGNTEAEALDDCLDMAEVTDADEQRIRDAYGPCDDTTAAEELGVEDTDYPPYW